MRANHPNGEVTTVRVRPVPARLTAHRNHRRRPAAPTEPRMTPEEQQQAFLSQLFLWIGALTTLALLLY